MLLLQLNCFYQLGSENNDQLLLVYVTFDKFLTYYMYVSDFSAYTKISEVDLDAFICNCFMKISLQPSEQIRLAIHMQNAISICCILIIRQQEQQMCHYVIARNYQLPNNQKLPAAFNKPTI